MMSDPVSTVGYLNGEYLPLDDIRISPLDRAALFGDALYEAIRAYSGNLFELDRHLRRMERGAKALRYPDFDFDALRHVSEELVARNELTAGDSLVYLQVSRGAAPRSHAFPAPDTPLTVFGYAKPLTIDKTARTEGVDVLLVPDQRWARCHIKTVGLLPNTLAYQAAHDTGSFEAVFVRDGMIMEGSHTNLLAVRSGAVISPPKSNYILDGITREVVRDLCGELSISYMEEPLPEAEIYSMDELILTSTTLEAIPVISISGRPIGDGKPGYITKLLQKSFPAKALYPNQRDS